LDEVNADALMNALIDREGGYVGHPAGGAKLTRKQQ